MYYMYFYTCRMFTVNDFEKFDLRILREILTHGELPILNDAETNASSYRGNFNNLLR